MAKVVLSDREVGLIKGLIQHKALNDQQVLAIFSFPTATSTTARPGQSGRERSHATWRSRPPPSGRWMRFSINMPSWPRWRSISGSPQASRAARSAVPTPSGCSLRWNGSRGSWAIQVSRGSDAGRNGGTATRRTSRPEAAAATRPSPAAERSDQPGAAASDRRRAPRAGGSSSAACPPAPRTCRGA